MSITASNRPQEPPVEQLRIDTARCPRRSRQDAADEDVAQDPGLLRAFEDSDARRPSRGRATGPSSPANHERIAEPESVGCARNVLGVLLSGQGRHHDARHEFLGVSLARAFRDVAGPQGGARRGLGTTCGTNHPPAPHAELRHTAICRYSRAGDGARTRGIQLGRPRPRVQERADPAPFRPARLVGPGTNWASRGQSSRQRSSSMKATIPDA